MIDLSNSPVLRESQNYRIYQHPDNSGALLKVRCDKPGKRRLLKHRILKRPSELLYGNLRQWNREANEYLAALHRGCPEIDCLAKFMGFARTSEGPALIVEKMTSPDGDLAMTVAEELAELSAGDPRRDTIRNELLELLDDLERGRIIVGDFSAANVVRARERNGRLVVVDGLGERILLPITLYSNLAFKASVARRRRRIRRIPGTTHHAVQGSKKVV
ncbi:YrbL family protein [Primorskyibacter sp. S87]|uniref:YrbL family protein n=1 Tax=Primorskyibacter sp. S87 TaxID=3415126 RepID=UPI003C7AD92D